MPFVKRCVEPKYLSRKALDGPVDNELEAVTNNTLSGTLRQLACLVNIANSIFDELTAELIVIGERSNKLKDKIAVVEEKVLNFNPKTIPVPESDLSTFSERTTHYVSTKESSNGLFSAATRPPVVRRLYEAAARTPIHIMRQMDKYRTDGVRTSKYFVCTPVLGNASRRRKFNLDIETRKPAVLEEMRQWTSTEALGEPTVKANGVCPAVRDLSPEGTDHRLPSPEEQQQVVALRFPGQMIRVDVTGRGFDRMTNFRRSLTHFEYVEKKRRKKKGRRRNTITGTDQKEIRDAVDGTDTDVPEQGRNGVSPGSSPNKCIADRMKDENVPRSSSAEFRVKVDIEVEPGGRPRPGTWDRRKSKSKVAEEQNIYEMITKKDDSMKSKPSISIPISTLSAAMNMAIKLRESSLRNGKDDGLHSSSGNWSASSSARASLESDNTQSKSSPPIVTSSSASSISLGLDSATSNSSSINQHQNFGPYKKVSITTSTSTSSRTSEGTLTPDIHDIPFVDDGETSSVYSCDTEGYYTSFHMDSGLKTLKEEPRAESMRTLNAENEYELFGKGSTSTTTSSAGTVCTTLNLALSKEKVSPPAVPPRISSLDPSNSQKPLDNLRIVTDMNAQTEIVQDVRDSSPGDSGHNTSSSPIESTSPQETLAPNSEYEFSESDLEGVERLERIRVKTTINSSRIPSMCVITPPQSDDESVKSSEQCRKFYGNAGALQKLIPTVPLSHAESYYISNKYVNSLPGQETNRFKSRSESTDSDSQCPQSSDQHSSRSSSDDNSSKVSNGSSHGNMSRVVMSNISGSSKMQVINVDSSGYATVSTVEKNEHATGGNGIRRAPSPSGGTFTLNNSSTSSTTDANPKPSQPVFKTPLLPFSFMGKVKDVFSAGVRRSQSIKQSMSSPESPSVDSNAQSGDYVTLADIKGSQKLTSRPDYAQATNVNKQVSRNSSVSPKRETEYVSWNDLPVSRSTSTSPFTTSPGSSTVISPANSLERKKRQGARVTLDSEGKVVYSSDSLPRNKGSQSTFEPGPYVKESIPSPTPARMTKTNIRPVTISGSDTQEDSHHSTYVPSRPFLSPSSPTMSHSGKVIIRAGNKDPSMLRVASPTDSSRATVIALSGPISPKSAHRGAYVNVQSNAPHEGRVASQEDRPQDFFGQQSGFQHYGRQPNIQPQGYSSIRSPGSRVNYKFQGNPTNIPTYHTLPSRRPDGSFIGARSVTPPVSQNHSSEVQKGGYYNTIASGKNYPPVAATNKNFYGAHVTSQQGCGRELNIHSPNRTNVINYAAKCVQNPYVNSPYQKYPPQNVLDSNHNITQPQHKQNYQSSVPSKQEPQVPRTLSTFTPIQNQKRQNLRLSPLTPNAPASNRNSFKSHSPQASPGPGSGVPKNRPLVSPIRSTMTSEELFAVIHRSKKKMNIKSDSDSFSRSGSPTSNPSISPGSSESSLGRCTTPVRLISPESGNFSGKSGMLIPGNRHSWSPVSSSDSSEYSKTSSESNARASPSQQTIAGSRQSWAGERLALVQPTSRNDFKRLLLQHSKSNPRERISAVELLKASKGKQNAGTPTTENQPQVKSPISPISPHYQNGSRLSSRSNGWRFYSPRTDVLSSTILEDCAEEEESVTKSPVKKPEQELSTSSNVITANTSNVNLLTKAQSPNPKDRKHQIAATRRSEIASKRQLFFSSLSPIKDTCTSPPSTTKNKSDNSVTSTENLSKSQSQVEENNKSNLANQSVILTTPSPRVSALLEKQDKQRLIQASVDEHSIMSILNSIEASKPKSGSKLALETAL